MTDPVDTVGSGIGDAPAPYPAPPTAPIGDTAALPDPEAPIEGAADRGAADPFLAEVRHAAEQLITEQKSRAADLVKGIAETLRRTAGELEDRQVPIAAGYAARAAGEVERWSDVVRDRSLEGLVADAEGLARRNPEWFLAGAAAAGFVLARFLKASSDRRSVGTATLAVPDPGID